MQANTSKINAKIKHNKIKCLQKYCWICFVWANDFWVCMWSTLEYGYNIQYHTIGERLTFSFASEYQLNIASWLGVGDNVHFTLLVLTLSSFNLWDSVYL